MSSTNKTSNLELSQFIGTDSPKWLTDYNSDMQKIDAGVSAVQTQADATDLVVSGHTSSIQSNTQSISDQQTAITSLRADVTAAQGSINTINSLIGNGEPTTTDKTIIGAINELAAEMPSPTTQLPATSVSYSNTTSGLTATNVQAAIDEVDAKVDAIPTTSSAANVTYNNSTSGLTATNVQAAIDEVANKNSSTILGTAVSLSAYTALSNAYTFPSDGYLRVGNGDTATATQAHIVDSNGADHGYISHLNNSSWTFVRKGMKTWVTGTSANGAVLQFVPFE